MILTINDGLMDWWIDWCPPNNISKLNCLLKLNCQIFSFVGSWEVLCFKIPWHLPGFEPQNLSRGSLWRRDPWAGKQGPGVSLSRLSGGNNGVDSKSALAFIEAWFCGVDLIFWLRREMIRHFPSTCFASFWPVVLLPWRCIGWCLEA